MKFQKDFFDVVMIISGTTIAQFVEIKVSNIRFVSSCPILGIGRNSPPVYPVAKWVPDI